MADELKQRVEALFLGRLSGTLFNKASLIDDVAIEENSLDVCYETDTK